MRLIQTLLRILFALLYHSFAWAYDLVAWLVSLGRWNKWILAVLPDIQGPRVLELGYGPGHLQCALRTCDLSAFGLDESRQMSRQAARHLRRNDETDLNLVRGLAQHLPYSSDAFQTVVATFPSEYFVDQRTLTEVNRVLVTGGKFIILLVAWLTGKHLHERCLTRLLRLSGLTGDPVGTITDHVNQSFLQAGFQVEVKRVDSNSSSLLIILASRS